MRFEFRPNPRLPRLAWGLHCKAATDVAVVTHGDWVESWQDGFVEGAWDGAFSTRLFDTSAVLAGTGGRIVNDTIRLATPTNTYERLQSVHVGGELFVSNSLALLLAMSGETLDPAHPHYYFDLLDHYRRGIRPKRKRLRLDGARTAELHDCCNLDIGPELRVVRREKQWGSAPSSPEHYLRMLEDTVCRVIENAADTGRRRPFRPVAMVSQGYDSSAVAALAAKAGCREAVTFLCSHSFHEGRYADDRGDAIADALGYQTVHTYERNDALTSAEFREEEYYFEPWGTDRGMAAMAAQLEGTLLLSGRSGEAIWTRGQRFRRGLPHFKVPVDVFAGSALGEFRMRIGFLHFPPATIALVHARAIHRWNASRALAPWSVGGDYDKPLARRILEEAGVAREAFGFMKKGGQERASSAPPTRSPRLPRWMHRWKARLLERALLYPMGNCLHSRWREGTFEVQRAAVRMIERYREALR